jgi:NAD(P)-dependent dehydrogenase (short-subunit alcohol dehydrogenase family)
MENPLRSSNIRAETYDVEMFRRLIDINVTGSFLCAQAVGRAMIEQKTGGSIVFVASMSGTIVNYPQQQSCYNASKAAVIQLSRSLAAEWAEYGIRCNSISPGYMDTALNRVPALDAQKQIWKSMTPQRRLGNVDELNGVALFLASDASTYMTGADLIIDVSLNEITPLTVKKCAHANQISIGRVHRSLERLFVSTSEDLFIC